MQNGFSESARVSRRHLVKAIGIAVGAVSATLPSRARAQSEPDWGGDGRCFLRGTRIRTGTGYRPIEGLAAGDMLPTQFSGTLAIRKIQNYIIRRDEAGRWPEDSRPVRIKAEALSENTPARDLIVTKAHAIFLDGVLVTIGSLVNGKTIHFDERDTAELEYFHVEFDTHDLIDAEGALCESLRDEATEACAPLIAFDGGRSQFYSRLRSAIAPLLDRRQPHDLIRDNLEARAGL